jgi:hypothetical protein
MSKTFWMFLAAGLAIVAAGIGLLFVGTEKNHLELKGEVLKVRTVALGPDATFAVADFRVKNPSNVQFVVKNVDFLLDLGSDKVEKGPDRIEKGLITSKADVNTMFEYQKLLGPKFNEVLSIKDTINAGKSGDFMVAARFEVPEKAIEMRRGVRLRIEDLDGAVAEISGQ